MTLKKKAYNNGYLEKNVIPLIKEFLKCENQNDAESLMRSYFKGRNSFTIGESVFYSLVLGNSETFDYELNFGTYVGFFDERHYLEKYKSTFKTLASEDFFKNVKELTSVYGADNMKRILYFFIFFKTKKFVTGIWSKKASGDNGSNKNIDLNSVQSVSKKDFAFIEVSKIVGRLKELEVHSFYRDNLLNEKLKSYFLSVGLGFKKMNYRTNVSSDNVLIPDLIDADKQNVFILEKGFREENKSIFQTGKENFVILMDKYMD